MDFGIGVLGFGGGEVGPINAPATLGTGKTGCTTLALLLAIHGLLGREVWGREDGWI